jgi:hypothetical protein
MLRLQPAAIPNAAQLSPEGPNNDKYHLNPRAAALLSSWIIRSTLSLLSCNTLALC